MLIKGRRGMCHNYNINGNNWKCKILLIIDCIPLAIVRTFRGLNIAAVSEFFMIFEIDWSVIDDFRSKFFFFTTRLLKNCYQDTCLKSEEFCTNGLCLIFAISIKIDARPTWILRKKNGEFALNCVWERKCFHPSLYLWIDFIYWLNWNISFPIILEDSLWLIEKDELSGKQRIVYMQTQLSMVCHSICSKQTAAGIISEWVRHLMSQRLLRKMKERQTAWELPRVIATCTVPKKMRPEDLPINFRNRGWWSS